jgi:carboxylesterase
MSEPYGVLVLHGLGSSQASVAALAERLARDGLPTEVPWLRGHGTRPEDLRGVTWPDWYADAATALDRLLERCASAAVVGLSMGALVALHLAVERSERLRAVVAVAPALYQAHPLAPLVPLVAPFRRYLPAPTTCFNDRACGARVARGYERLPTSAVLTLLAYARWLEPRLHRIQTPTLIVHSRTDRVIRPDSATRIYARLGAAEKELCWFERSGHEMFLDCEGDAVLAVVERFILTHAPRPLAVAASPALQSQSASASRSTASAG